jgi:ABC-type multidrug transport system fused ATPase/permease subunit
MAWMCARSLSTRLHQQIGLIPQEPGLFHRSIRENIHYGRLDASMDEVAEAIHRAGASEFIDSMEQGYESLVGERGSSFPVVSGNALPLPGYCSRTRRFW